MIKAMETPPKGEIKTCEMLWHGTEVKGYVLITRVIHPYYRIEVDELRFDYDQEFPSGGSWLREQIEVLVQKYAPKLRVYVPQMHRDLIPTFLDLKLGISALELRGETAQALVSMQATAEMLWPAGLVCRRLGPDAYPSILRLREESLRSDSLVQWYAGSSDFWRIERERLKNLLRDGTCFGIEMTESSSIQGYFGFLRRTPIGGRLRAGVEIVLSPPLRLRKLARASYRVMLKAMEQQGIALFDGVTQHPAIVHLSRIQRREVLAFHLADLAHCPSPKTWRPFL